jgi:hypothetical protein
MDPIKFDAGDPNIFRYVGNDPVNKKDPWGLDDGASMGVPSTGYALADTLGGAHPGDGAYSRQADIQMSIVNHMGELGVQIFVPEGAISESFEILRFLIEYIVENPPIPSPGE